MLTHPALARAYLGMDRIDVSKIGHDYCTMHGAFRRMRRRLAYLGNSLLRRRHR